MISDWPVYKDEWNSPEAELAIGSFQEVVRGIRKYKNQHECSAEQKNTSDHCWKRCCYLSDV